MISVGDAVRVEYRATSVSNGVEGIVLSIDRKQYSTPIVRVLTNRGDVNWYWIDVLVCISTPPPQGSVRCICGTITTNIKCCDCRAHDPKRR